MDNINERQESEGNGKREAASYPYYPLSAALKIGDAVKDLGGNNAGVQKRVLASHLGESEKSPVLSQRIASAKCFGIIEGRSIFTLSDAARRYYLPTAELERSTALLDFLQAPSSFAEVIKRFDGTKLPSREILANIFHREGRVPDSWKDRIAAFFSSSAELAGALDVSGFLRFRTAKERGLSKSVTGVTVPSVESNRTTVSPSAQTIEKLDRSVDGTDSTVWDFSYKGKSVRIITPTELDEVLWSKLDAYIKLLKPAGGKPA